MRKEFVKFEKNNMCLQFRSYAYKQNYKFNFYYYSNQNKLKKKSNYTKNINYRIYKHKLCYLVKVMLIFPLKLVYDCHRYSTCS